MITQIINYVKNFGRGMKSKNENVIFAENQFKELLKKNLAIPVSTYTL